MAESEAKPPEKRAFDITGFCDRYHVGRTTFYKELGAGRLKVVKVGKRVLVKADDAEEWLRNLPAA